MRQVENHRFHHTSPNFTCDGKDFVYINFLEDSTFTDLSNRINRLSLGNEQGKSLKVFDNCLKVVCDSVSGMRQDPFILTPRCNALHISDGTNLVKKKETKSSKELFLSKMTRFSRLLD